MEKLIHQICGWAMRHPHGAAFILSVLVLLSLAFVFSSCGTEVASNGPEVQK